MRYVFLAAAAVAACGGSGNGLSSVAATDVTVTVAILGPGVVRGGGLSTDCGNNCSFVVPAGTTVHLLSVPDPNATFSGWSGPCSGLASCDLVAQANVTVGAIFARMEPPPPPRRTATLAVDLSGSGSVVSTPAGIDCPRVCSATFTADTDVVLTAMPADGFSFGGFSAPCSAAACSVHLAGDGRVTAAFAPIPLHRIAVVVSGSGAGRVSSAPPGIDCPGACEASFREGTTVALAAMPDPLSQLAGFSGACAGNSCSVKVQADTAAVARFENRRYVVMDLGVVPGAWWSGASSISPNGRFVTGNVGGQNDVFFWDGVMHPLGFGFAFAGGVNDAGVVAGTFEPDPQTGAMQGFRWRAGGRVALTSLGGSSSQVSAINRDGVIVGWALRADGIQRAVFWNGIDAVDLGSLGGGFFACSIAYGINAAGTIVGESCVDGGGNHPVRFRGPGAIDDLGTLGGNFGIASAVNDAGVIVGYSSADSSGVYRGFVYQDGRMIDAGSLPGLPFSELVAVNGKGVAVGLAFNASGVQRAVAWAAGRMIDLNTVVDGTPYTLNSMAGIDEAGNIVGSGIDNGVSRAVILRPQ